MALTPKGYLTIGAALVGATGLALLGRKLYRNHQLNKEVRMYDKETYDASGRKIPKRSIIGARNVTPGDTPVQKINLVEVSDSLARNLGVMYPGWDPRNWSENDEEVFNIIKALPQPLIPRLIEVYKEKYKRNLRGDLEKLLDDQYYRQIKNLFY